MGKRRKQNKKKAPTKAKIDHKKNDALLRLKTLQLQTNKLKYDKSLRNTVFRRKLIEKSQKKLTKLRDDFKKKYKRIPRLSNIIQKKAKTSVNKQYSNFIVSNLRKPMRKHKKIEKSGLIKVSFPNISPTHAKMYLRSLPTNNRRMSVSFGYNGDKGRSWYSTNGIYDNTDDAYDEFEKYILDNYDTNVDTLDSVYINIMDLDIRNDMNYLRSLKAFGVISDRKFHDANILSLPANCKNCIYWTYLTSIGLLTVGKGVKVTNKIQYVNNMLRDEEDEDIRYAAKHGNLNNFLILVTKRDKKDNYLFLDNEFIRYNVNGDIHYVDPEDVPDKQVCYHKKYDHVAGAFAHKLIKLIGSGEINEDFDEDKMTMIISPIRDAAQSRYSKMNRKYHFFDLENYSNGKYGVTCDVSENEDGTYNFRHFYKVSEFANYIDRLSVKNTSKTRPKGKTTFHDFYAHNGANYDFLYIWHALNDVCKITNHIFAGNALKAFEYGSNIFFKDSNLIIRGTLAKLVNEVFKVKVKISELPINYYNLPDDDYVENKEVYPYKFYTEETKNYKGAVPGPEYFNTKKDYELCLKNHGDMEFDLEKYTLYYCYLDCLLGYKMLMKYQELNSIQAKCTNSEFDLVSVKKCLYPMYRQKQKGGASHRGSKGTSEDLPNYWGDVLGYIKKQPEFKTCDFDFDISVEQCFIDYSHNHLSFDPLAHKTTSSKTISKFKKLYNRYNFIGISAKWGPAVKDSYGGGVTDVFKKRFVHKSKDMIYEVYKTLTQEEFNEFMKKGSHPPKNVIHKDDINSSYPNAMLGNIPHKFIGAIGFGDSSKKVDFVNSILETIINDTDGGDNMNLKEKLEFMNNNIRDDYLYQISYEYWDKKWISNIYIHQDDKYMGVSKSEGQFVWGNIVKQGLTQHLENDVKKHGCSPRFKYILVTGFLKFESKPVFREYILSLYEKRLEIKKKIYQIEKEGKVFAESLEVLNILSSECKSDMNNLYGKFGQRTFGQTFICSPEEFRTIALKHEGYVENVKFIENYDNPEKSVYLVTIKKKKKNAIGNLTYVASFITSAARVALFDMVYSAGVKNVYYVDTDSCYYQGPRIGKIHASKLGYRDSEINENIQGDNILITEAYFNAPKFYGTRGFIKNLKGDWVMMKDIVKSKGVKKGLISFDQIRDLNLEKEMKVDVKCNQFNRYLNESVVIVKDIMKEIKCVYSKRVFNNNNSSMY